MFRIAMIAGIHVMVITRIVSRIRGRGRPTVQVAFVDTACTLSLALASTALAVTGFITALLNGSEGHAVLLLIHVGAGGVFVPTLAVSAVLWAESALPRTCTAGDASLKPRRTFSRFGGICFWIALAAGLGVSLTALISMTPAAGADGIAMLANAHRWFGLITAMAVMGLSVR